MKKLCSVCKSRKIDLEKDDYLKIKNQFVCLACDKLVHKMLGHI